MGGLGLGGTDHALLGAVVERPDSGGVVLTGRLSLADQPWLADHVVGGVVLFPGAGFVELVMRAGDEVGCAVIEELVLSAPLVLPAAGGVQVQVVVGAADESGSRAVSVFSLPASIRIRVGVACRGRAGQWIGRSRPRICRCGRRRARSAWMSPMVMSGWRGAVMSMGRRFGGWGRCGGAELSCSPKCRPQEPA